MVANKRGKIMMGFAAPKAEKTIELAVPDKNERVFCLSLQTSVSTFYEVQNAGGRFGRPGLIAPLVVR